MLGVCDSLGSSLDCWAWSSMMLKSVWGVILLLLCESASKRASRPLRVVFTPAVLGMKLRQNLWIKQSASRLQECRKQSCQTKESSCSKLIAEGSACSVNRDQ